MGKKNKKQIDLKNLTPEEQLKMEIADEIGILDRVLNGGWGSLSAKETGKVGGLVAQKKKELKKQVLREKHN